MCESGYALLFMSEKWSYFHPTPFFECLYVKDPNTFPHQVILAGFSVGSEAGLTFFFSDVVEPACTLKISSHLVKQNSKSGKWAELGQPCSMRPEDSNSWWRAFALVNHETNSCYKCRYGEDFSFSSTPHPLPTGVCSQSHVPNQDCNKVIEVMWGIRPHMMWFMSSELEIPAAMR